ncbi:hypothetical protein [Enterococcus caccae]|uniref:Uncharacterized protein n=1 Tax=Enterococcus caccae ATCC BAA-1240 TaxID=1158612 RepID=R3WEB5_9ENTE|nr:hypothetical protein [Enterococcus caccae]EOL45802.1 hypothetical protein UC7_01599 [Enterococcus caccae ATCC BAA-1240]EOT60998.1 hypothetical protein I580_01900 [Enterococcus caccae ATCC BAA-1240]OJG27971.1 hypothetical protein RU98_GL002180 [Enterococcus caccae]
MTKRNGTMSRRLADYLNNMGGVADGKNKVENQEEKTQTGTKSN